MRGFSDANGSWKMIWTALRARCSAAPSSANRSSPSSSAWPSIVACRAAAARWPCRWSSCRSPIRRPAPASARPAMSNETPSTATKPLVARCSKPVRIGKRTRRSLTCSSGVDALRPLVGSPPALSWPSVRPARRLRVEQPDQSTAQQPPGRTGSSARCAAVASAAAIKSGGVVAAVRRRPGRSAARSGSR